MFEKRKIELLLKQIDSLNSRISQQDKIISEYRAKEQAMLEAKQKYEQLVDAYKDELSQYSECLSVVKELKDEMFNIMRG